MTREQAKAWMKEHFGIEDATKEQVDAFLNTLNGEVATERNKATNAQASATEATTKAAELQAQLEELQNSGKSETDNLSRELEKAQKQIAELQRQSTMAEVKAILSAGGLQEADYKDFIDGFIGSDAEVSKTRANAFVSAMNNRIATAEEGIRKGFLNNTKGLGDNGGASNKPGAEKTAAESIVGNFKNVPSKGEGDVSSFL